MVQAIVEERKTQTRRVLKPQPVFFGRTTERIEVSKRNDVFEFRDKMSDCGFSILKAIQPKYNIGDVLWVKETFRPKGHSFPIGEHFEYKATAEKDGNPINEPWKPSIFMPKDAARIWLEITDVRVERLNKISNEDAIAEGIEFKPFDIDNGTEFKANRFTNYLLFNKPFFSFSEYQWNFGKEIHSAPVASYCTLWESINGEGSWNLNPFVWVIEFKRIERPANV